MKTTSEHSCGSILFFLENNFESVRTLLREIKDHHDLKAMWYWFCLYFLLYNLQSVRGLIHGIDACIWVNLYGNANHHREMSDGKFHWDCLKNTQVIACGTYIVLLLLVIVYIYNNYLVNYRIHWTSIVIITFISI